MPRITPNFIYTDAAGRIRFKFDGGIELAVPQAAPGGDYTAQAVKFTKAENTLEIAGLQVTRTNANDAYTNAMYAKTFTGAYGAAVGVVYNGAGASTQNLVRVQAPNPGGTTLNDRTVIDDKGRSHYMQFGPLTASGGTFGEGNVRIVWSPVTVNWDGSHSYSVFSQNDIAIIGSGNTSIITYQVIAYGIEPLSQDGTGSTYTRKADVLINTPSPGYVRVRGFLETGSFVPSSSVNTPAIAWVLIALG